MNNILEINRLSVSYPSGRSGIFSRGSITAVEDFCLELEEGCSLGLAGESGSGKSTVARAASNLLKFNNPGVRISGNIVLKVNGEVYDYARLNRGERARLRNYVQFIFQDPSGSLNPRFNIGEIIQEPLKHLTSLGKSERKNKVMNLLELTGLGEEIYYRFPHELSGGQKQRAGIARALAAGPKILIADEPLSSLDVSVQAQIINLFRRLKNELNLTLVFVSHDLSVIENLCTDVAVMYLGKIMERGKCGKVFSNPGHPYTKALISSVPVPVFSEDKQERILLSGDIPSTLSRPMGCVFAGRCPEASDECLKTVPPLEAKEDGREVACIKRR